MSSSDFAEDYKLTLKSLAPRDRHALQYLQKQIEEVRALSIASPQPAILGRLNVLEKRFLDFESALARVASEYQSFVVKVDAMNANIDRVNEHYDQYERLVNETRSRHLATPIRVDSVQDKLDRARKNSMSFHMLKGAGESALMDYFAALPSYLSDEKLLEIIPEIHRLASNEKVVETMIGVVFLWAGYTHAEIEKLKARPLLKMSPQEIVDICKVKFLERAKAIDPI